MNRFLVLFLALVAASGAEAKALKVLMIGPRHREVAAPFRL